MASTPQPINVAVLASNTTLYTAFVAGGASRAIVVSMDFTNTTTADITLTVFFENAGVTVTRDFCNTLTVPAKGTLSWRGGFAFDTSSDKLRAIASAVGIDCVGMVTENA